jgi:hypothetical protein
MPIIRSLRLYRWPQCVEHHLGCGRLLVWYRAGPGRGMWHELVQHPSDRTLKPTAMHQTSNLP